MYEISGSIRGRLGRLLFDETANILRFSTVSETLFEMDAEGVSLNLRFAEKQIRVLDHLVEVASIDGAGEIDLSVREAMTTYGRYRTTDNSASLPPVRTQHYAPTPAASTPPPAPASPTSSTTAVPSVTIPTAQPTPPVRKTSTSPRLVKTAKKVNDHGSLLHRANLGVLILNMLSVSVYLIFYLQADLNDGSKLVFLIGAFIAAFFFYLAYVGIEFVIQLGILFATWVVEG